jgi:uncharacterized membrane-anchored protein
VLRHPLSPFFALALLALLASPALSQNAEAPPGQEPLHVQWTEGPAKVSLGDHAEVDLPAGYQFAGADDTRKLMERMGNPSSGNEMGLIAPSAEGTSWFVVFEWDAVGYVKDDEKDEIDASALLDSIKEGTEAANEKRKEMGATPLHVTGWYEQPHYDAATHNLVWAIKGRSEGETEDVINYEIRLLGRRGYMAATLVGGPNEMVAGKPGINSLLAAYSYKHGEQYAQFVQGDKVAEYGLTALVLGGAGAAAAKLGLFAKLGKLLAKGAKLIAVALAAIGAWIKRLFTGRRKQEEPTGVA